MGIGIYLIENTLPFFFMISFNEKENGLTPSMAGVEGKIAIKMECSWLKKKRGNLSYE